MGVNYMRDRAESMVYLILNQLPSARSALPASDFIFFILLLLMT